MKQRIDWESGFIIATGLIAILVTPLLLAAFGTGIGEITTIVFLVLAVLAGVRGTAKVLASRREYEREHSGRCVECGYDLRESHERCPECGTDVSTAPAPPEVRPAPMHPILYATILIVVAGVVAFVIMAHTMVSQISRNSSH